MRRILRNAGSILIGDAAAQVLVGAAIAIAAVRLGPAGFGTLSTAQAYVEPFTALAAFGLQQVAITQCATRGGCDGTLRGSVFGVQMSFAIVGIVASIVAAAATGRASLVPLIAVLGVGTLWLPMGTAAMLPFQFDQAMHRLLAIPFIASLVQFTITYWAMTRCNVPIGYQMATVAGTIATMALTFVAMRRFYPAPLRFDRALAKRLIVMAWPLATLDFVVMAYSRGSYFFLNAAGPLAQGEYAAADRLVKPVLHVAGALFMSSLPTVAVLAAERKFTALRGLYVKGIIRLLQALIPFVLVAWVLAGWLLRKFAPEYAGATTPFRVLSTGALFMFINQLSTIFIVALGKFRAIMAVAIVNLFVYLGLASVLVPRWGAVGAATATSVMEAVNTAMQVVLVLTLLRRSAVSGGPGAGASSADVQHAASPRQMGDGSASPELASSAP